MEQAITIGLDIAKHVFHAHGADAAGHVLFRKRLTRAKLLGFLAAQAPCVVAMEACAGSHYWGREIGKLGHAVRLIPPAYVKPFVKRQKNDAADAEAICEAAQRPSMRFVPVKDEEQQANGVVFRARDLLVRQRTQCINALRGHLSEYGYVFRQGITHAATLVAHVENPNSSLPERARVILRLLIDTFSALEMQIKELDGEINRRSRADPVARRQMTIPGVGPDCCHRNHGPRAGGGELPSRTRFRRLARTDATPEIDWRKAEARRHFETGRADHSPLAHPRGQRGDPAGLSVRGARRILAGADAGPQAEDAGHRRLGQQDGSRRLGSIGQRRDLPSSGHGGVS
jgi:Transposase